MSVDLPTWTAFEPDALPGPPATPPGRVVAVLASPQAQGAGWAAALTTELAGAWSRAGSRVVLADLGLTRPTLHAELGEPNGEGVTDAVLFGASVMRVARLVAGQSFFLVPAGTVTADSEAILGSPKWGRLCSGFQEAGVLLMTFVPADEPARSAVLAGASDVVVLAGEGEDVSTLVSGVDAHILGVLGRAGSSPPTEEGDLGGVGAVGSSPEVPSTPEASEAGTTAFGSLDSSSGGGPAEASFASSGEPPVAARTPAARVAAAKVPQRASGRRVGLIVAVVIIVALLVASWLGYVPIPGISRHAGVEAPSDGSNPAGAHTARPTTSPVQGYSVSVGAFPDLRTAQARAGSLSKVASDVLVTVVPTEDNGTVVYRVLVGLAADSAQALSLARRVGQLAHAGSASWVVRPTPRAFMLGEMGTPDAARARVEELKGLGVPAYVLAVDYADGSTGYRIYAGAFADDGEAAWMKQDLAGKGLSDATLSNRIGRLPE